MEKGTITYTREFYDTIQYKRMIEVGVTMPNAERHFFLAFAETFENMGMNTVFDLENKTAHLRYEQDVLIIDRIDF